MPKNKKDLPSEIKKRHLHEAQTQTEFIIPVENHHTDYLVSESSLLQKRTFSQMESVKQRSLRLTKMLAYSSALLPAEVILDGVDSMFQNSVDDMKPPTVTKMTPGFNILN
jgi:hypothetical protein